MRIVVHVSADKFPELHEALTRVPAKGRSSRLSLLATLGAITVSGSGASGNSPAPTAVSTNPTTADLSPKDAARAQALRAKLLGGV